MTVAVRIDETDPTPPYEQLRRQFVVLINSGTLQAGARLPPVRQLAHDLALATGTVARTYQELEKAGLVRSRRGAGTSVTDAGEALSPEIRGQRVETLIREAVRQALLMGATDSQVRQTVDAYLGSTERT